MSNDRRHLRHIRTNMLQYVRILKSDIPVSSAIQQVGSVPSPAQIAEMADPPKYIQVTSNNWYYGLGGKRPDGLITYGEIAIAYSAGYERLYIVNGNNEIVEFRPYSVDKTSAHIYSLENGPLVSSGGTCIWSIPFADISGGGVNPNYATVSLRNLQTGEQVLPDAVFDATSNALKITIYSMDDIPSGRYRAVMTSINHAE